MKNTKIFALSDSYQLGKNIANYLNLELGNLDTEIFSDGEISPNFEESVRGHKLYIVGSTHQPSDNLMELVFSIDAAKRGGAKQINVVVPYFGYARQDRKGKQRSPVSSKCVAQMIQNAGADSIMIVDLHANQIEGFFDIPVIHIQGNNIFIPFLKNNIDYSNTVICSPDAGGVVRAKYFSDNLNLPLVVINKRRDKPNSIDSMELAGDVSNKDVIIVDDIADTAGSLCRASNLLKDNGANSVMSCITHGVLSGNALEKIKQSSLDKVYITDTIPVKKTLSENIEILSSSEAIGKVIKATSEKKSVDNHLKHLIET